MTLYTKFIQSKRHGRLVAREIKWFNWTVQAMQKRNALHNHIVIQKTTPPVTLPKKSKEERLKNLPFSLYHNKLVENLYCDNKENRILKQQAEKAAHELKIKRLIQAKKHREMLKKQRKAKQCMKKIVISTVNTKCFNTLFTTNPYPVIQDIMRNMHIKLSLKQPNYKAISLYCPPEATTSCFMFVNNRAALLKPSSLRGVMPR